jgi:PAS domain S-box-containing protein
MDDAQSFTCPEMRTVIGPAPCVEPPDARVATLEAARDEAWRACATAQQQLRTLIEYAPEAIVMLDVESGRFIDANPMAERLFGLSRQALLNTGPLALSAPSAFHGPSPERGRRMIEVALHGGAPVFEWWHCNAQGERFPCEIRLVRMPWADREVLRGTLIDVSDRKYLELSERGRRLILDGIARGSPLNDSLDGLVRMIEELLPGMICSVLLLNPETRCLHLGAAPSLPCIYNAAVDGLAIGPAVGSCGAAAFTGQRVIVADVTAHPNWAGFQPLANQVGFRACWSEPVMALSGEVLGTFAMYYAEPREPAPVELRAIELAAQLAGLAIEHDRAQRLERDRRDRAELTLRSRDHDLDVARRIQEKMLPKQLPHVTGLDVAGRCCPAQETGGDFFDYHASPDGRLNVVVADVASHGFAPALIMVETRRLLRTLARAGCDVAEILTVTNRAVHEDTDDTMFVTAFVAQLDPATRALSYIGAGHEAYLFEPTGTIKRLASISMPLGVVEDLEFPAADTQPLRPGELLLLLSDGFQEAHAPNGTLFGIESAWESVLANAERPAEEIIDALFRSVRAFCHPALPGDDTTAVIVKVLPQPT